MIQDSSLVSNIIVAMLATETLSLNLKMDRKKMFFYMLKRGSTDLSELVVRMMLAIIFIYHGYQKLTGIDATVAFFASKGLEPALLLAYLAACGELIGGILIGLGFLTRLAALNGIIIMIIAIITAHLDQGFKGMSFQLLILACFVMFLISGAGRFSIDYRLRTKR